ncbi:MAG: glucose 1-dehydrogenase [Bryobacteraceae bacterium]|jgi:NAD(P)-dependent dehydrogenase (short-subunit alcohol dehydrogenase family)
MSLQGKVAIVTGSGVGIGRSIAERFAREGASVVLAEVNAASGKAAAEAIRAGGGDCFFSQTDVSCEDDVRRVVDEARRRYGKIDVLCNNAAIMLSDKEARAHELSREAWDRTLAVNLTGYWLCSKYVIPAMLEKRSGSIILVASPTGLLGFPKLTAYSASKGGVFALMRAMAADYGPEGIRVNAIVPGTIDTPMNAKTLSTPENRARFAAMAPLGRLGSPDDLAGIALFLASEDSAYCTGAVFAVDGGQTATV